MNEQDGKADLKDGEWKGDEFVVAKIDEDEYKENREASDACPVGIIRLD
jgi:ferredoxin